MESTHERMEGLQERQACGSRGEAGCLALECLAMNLLSLSPWVWHEAPSSRSSMALLETSMAMGAGRQLLLPHSKALCAGSNHDLS